MFSFVLRVVQNILMPKRKDKTNIMSLLLQIERRDPLAELSSSLSTRQSAACDGDSLHMECPAATKISIQVRGHHQEILDEKKRGSSK